MAGVVVGTGRSASSAGAVRWALEAGSLRKASVTLLHAWSEPVDVEVTVAGGARSGWPGWSSSRAVPGDPAEALLAAPADLVVLGLPDGLRCPPRLVCSVLRRSRVPVVVVPQAWWPSSGPVVVGICGTTASAAALCWAAAEAGRRCSALVAVHAWHGAPMAAHVRSAVDDRCASQVEERARGWIDHTLGPQSITLDVRRGPRLEALLDAASSAALLVLGGGLHRRLDRLLNGTVGLHVAALAGCPVAVVPDRTQAQERRWTSDTAAPP